jgi:hypothetical protein
MRPWVIPTIIFFLGLGLGLSAPMLASRYMNPYLPDMLKERVHPLEGAVIHKQHQQDRLLVTITTPAGTILATFQQQIPEINLLIEERDLVTLDVQHYQPFVTDPAILRVIKQQEETFAPPGPTPSSNDFAPTPGSGSDSDISPALP